MKYFKIILFMLFFALTFSVSAEEVNTSSDMSPQGGIDGSESARAIETRSSNMMSPSFEPVRGEFMPMPSDFKPGEFGPMPQNGKVMPDYKPGDMQDMRQYNGSGPRDGADRGMPQGDRNNNHRYEQRMEQKFNDMNRQMGNDGRQMNQSDFREPTNMDRNGNMENFDRRPQMDSRMQGNFDGGENFGGQQSMSEEEFDKREAEMEKKRNEMAKKQALNMSKRLEKEVASMLKRIRKFESQGILPNSECRGAIQSVQEGVNKLKSIESMDDLEDARDAFESVQDIHMCRGQLEQMSHVPKILKQSQKMISKLKKKKVDVLILEKLHSETKTKFEAAKNGGSEEAVESLLETLEEFGDQMSERMGEDVTSFQFENKMRQESVGKDAGSVFYSILRFFNPNL